MENFDERDSIESEYKYMSEKREKRNRQQINRPRPQPQKAPIRKNQRSSEREEYYQKAGASAPQHSAARQIQRQRLHKQRVKQQKVTRFYVILIVILLIVEIILVGQKLTSGKVKPIMSIVNISQINLESESAVAAPVQYDLEGALKQLKIRQAKDHRYARILENQGQYSENLLVNLANNPELLGFVLSYQGETDYQEGAQLTEEELQDNCPLLLQWDERWGAQAYGDNNIACSGCGPTALSMVVVGLTHNPDATPADVAHFATMNGYYEDTVGTRWALMDDGAQSYGLTSESFSGMDEAAMKQQLDSGKLLICSMRAGDFTTAGHFIVVYGYDENGFKIRDPFCIYRTNQAWSYDSLSSQTDNVWAMGTAEN